MNDEESYTSEDFDEMLKYLTIDEEEELTAADDFLGQYPVERAHQ